ncbi:RING finger protein 141 [Aplysia californica]|uniref:RING finger protein 141 n=1 Tax=Aplysia californica TaxID=6500 RepID=A0ABM0JMC5_APLCA|nr:RING finger protein 141 [Aplysia californica]
MGQATSSVSTADGDLRQLQGQFAANFNIVKSLATVSHAEVVDCIEELNTVTRSFTDRAGKQLRFLIKRGTDTTFLWKGTIRIRCLKINTSTSVIESSRLLTLRQFVVTYKEIIEQVAMLSRAPADPSAQEDSAPGTSAREELTASAFFPESKKQAHTEVEEDPVNECCVCMDRKACVMLSCCHEFCEICIDNWTRDERHSNCPLCRTKVAGHDDTWILTDKTDTSDYEGELKGYLVGLADRSRGSTHS